jgi:hypothetical protein
MLKRYFFLPVYCALLWLMPGSVMSETGVEAHPVIKAGAGREVLFYSSVTDAEIVFKKIFNELLAEVNESFTVKIYDNNDMLIRDFKEGKLEVLVLDSLLFLELEDLIHPNGRFIVQLGPSLKQRYLILVRSGDEDTLLADLRDRGLSIARGHLVAKRFLDVTLMQQGLPVSDRFFKESDMSKSSNTAIIDLFFGRVDLVVVPEFGYELALELNPQLRNATTVLAKSEPLVHEIVGARFDFPKERLDRIRPHLVKLPTKRIQLLFEAFHVTRFHLAKEDALNEVRELDKKYRVLIGQAR